jgi:hypothetical protein
MNIEKVKNYNQKLLAVFGTLAVVFVAGAMLISLAVFISDIWPGGRNIQDGLLSDEQAAGLQQENKRKQIVSYGMPDLIDTVNLVYIVPVAAQTLERPEGTVPEALDLYPSSSFGKTERYYYSSPRFTNLLVYDSKNETAEQLFSQRVLAGMYHPAYFQDDILLLFLFADKDTNNDGAINLDDYTALGIYSFRNKELLRVAREGCTVCAYNFIEGSKDLLVMFGSDKDKNGQYNESKEPSFVMHYHCQTRQLTDIVPEEMQDNLQRLVEGREIK